MWNESCFANLTAYLKRKEVRALGKPAIVVKGCDERALVVLEKESQVERAEIYTIGMACQGMGQPKCAACDTHLPRFADETIAADDAPAPAATADRYAALDPLLQQSPEERLAFWTAEFDRCLKCYACRQVCPMCYCERCLADKNRPQAIDSSPHPQRAISPGTSRAPSTWPGVAWAATSARAPVRRASTCACSTLRWPAPRRRSSDIAREWTRRSEPLVGAYSLTDKEEFIR